MIPQCIDQGRRCIHLEPLDRGVLAGKPDVRDGEKRTTDRTRWLHRLPIQPADESDVVERVAKEANERGLPRAPVALSLVDSTNEESTAPIVGAQARPTRR